jgi:hypothetical protein
MVAHSTYLRQVISSGAFTKASAASSVAATVDKCVTVTAHCHALDRGRCPAVVDWTSGMHRPPWKMGYGRSAPNRPEDQPPAPALTGEGLTAGSADAT